MAHLDLFIQLAFTAFGALLLIIFNGISKNISRLTISVESLNKSMASVVTKVDNHEKRLDHLERSKGKRN